MNIQNIPETNQKRVVIIGGGFAGLKLAVNLADGFWSKSPVQVVLIDRQNYHQFQPLFYQVATAGLEPSAISFPFRKVFQKKQNIHYRMAELRSVDSANNVITTNIGTLQYDYLVIATGADTNYFGQQNIIRNCLPMKTTGEALFIRNTILHNFEHALNMKIQEDISEFLSIVIVGGGATGVELAGAISEMKRYVLPKDYPELDFSLMRILLVESGKELLGAMSKKAQQQSLMHLRDKLGVEVRLETRVTDYDGDFVHFADGSTVRANTVIWAAGISSHRIEGLNSEIYGRGNRIQTDAQNRIKGYENIFALGDIACITTDPRFPNGHPQLAPVAMQQGIQLAANLINAQKGKPFKDFQYVDKGSMATVGRNMAVVDSKLFSFGGFIAWLGWLFVHLLYIIGTKNKTGILLNWAWAYFTYDQSLRLLIRPKEKQKDGKLEVVANHIDTMREEDVFTDPKSDTKNTPSS
jgi:NADH:ubiquinone reductase (H+-translocating)